MAIMGKKRELRCNMVILLAAFAFLLPFSLAIGETTQSGVLQKESISELESSKVFFYADSDMKSQPALVNMFERVIISLGCGEGYFCMSEEQAGPELGCGGVSLLNEFEGKGGRSKQTLTLHNNTGVFQRRLVGITLVSAADGLVLDSGALELSSDYKALGTKKSTTTILDSGDPDFEPVEVDLFSGTKLGLSKGGEFIGTYDWGDLSGLPYASSTFYSYINGKTFIKTIIEVGMAPWETVVLDPAYDFNNTANFSARWNGALPIDTLGMTTSITSGLGVLVVNVDNNLFANDLLLVSPYADVNGKSNSGAVYLIKDIGSKSGVFDLTGLPNFDVRWNGGTASDQLGYTNNSGSGAMLVDIDGNGYTNDLILVSYLADLNGKSNNGGVYLIKDIDKLSGVKDLVSLSNFSARWNGALAQDALGQTNSSGDSVLLGNVDNNSFANDLIMAANTADVNGKSDSGAVYLVKDAHLKSGVFDLNVWSKFDARWNGGVATDTLAMVSQGNPGMQLADIDGNSYSNDLLLGAYLADVNGKTNNGAVYLIKDIDKKSGVFDLNNWSNFDVRWNGPGSGGNDYLGNSSKGSSIVLVNIDGNSYSNDLFLGGSSIDVNGKSDSGAIYLVKDVHLKSGVFDLNYVGFDVRWNGGVASDALTGFGTSVGPGFIIGNIDGNSYANDFIFGAYLADFNGKSNNGVLYLKKDIDKMSGVFDVNYVGFDVRWIGAAASDNLGYNNTSKAMIELVNIDNNAFANDLLISASLADVNGKTNSGAVYLIKDINRLSGSRDLSVTSNFDARWNGALGTDGLGYSGTYTESVMLVNVDNNLWANDLLLCASLADVNGKADNGAVYLVKDIHRKSGVFDLNVWSNFDVRWNGGEVNDQLTNGSTTLGTVQLVNVDGGTYANDLMFSAPLADVNLDLNGNTNSGAVYLIEDIDSISGVKDLNFVGGFTSRWDGNFVHDGLGHTNNSGVGFQVVNLQGDYNNDLIITATQADVNAKSNNGAVYMVNNIATVSPCVCPLSGNWIINTPLLCTLDSACSLNGGGVHIQQGGIYISPTGTLVIPAGKKLILNKSPDANFMVARGGKLIFRK